MDDTLYLAYYYFEVFQGEYTNNLNHYNVNTYDVILKHFLRRFIGTKINDETERDFLNLIKSSNPRKIKRDVLRKYPPLTNRSDSEERILFREKKLLEILRKIKNNNNVEETEEQEEEKAPPIIKKVEKEPEIELPGPYKSIEDYTAKTQKRFRMTKNQKQRGLTREQAFKEFIHGS